MLTDEEPEKQEVSLNETGLGIDLGVKELAVVSDGKVYENKNKTQNMKKPEKKLKREQRCLSRKYKNKKKRGEKLQTKKSANIEKNVPRVQSVISNCSS